MRNNWESGLVHRALRLQEECDEFDIRLVEIFFLHEFLSLIFFLCLGAYNTTISGFCAQFFEILIVQKITMIRAKFRL